MSAGEAPEDRCGFVVEPGDVTERVAERYEAGSDGWHEVSDAVCCWRKVWDGAETDRCIWHAETEDKPAEALIDARADDPERLDGAYVPAVELGDAIDFDGCGLQGATFAETGLGGTSFAEISGRYARFPDADLQQAEFPNANLQWVQFTNVDLRRAQFPDAELYRAQFSDANLRDVQFPNSSLIEAQFSNTNLRQARFPDADLPATKFHGADLTAARFPRAVLDVAEFSDADLVGAKFPDANLLEAEFHDTALGSTEFPDADLKHSEFPGADLHGAEFSDADLRGAEFEDADLTGTDLTDIDAASATFAKAILERSTLTGADLGDADLTDARLHDAHFLDVRINERTSIGTVIPEEAFADWFAGSNLSILSRVRWLLTWWRADGDALEDHRDQFDRARTVYRTIQRLYRENSMPEKIDDYHIRAKETQRKQAIIDNDLRRWINLAGQRWIMGYGERPWQVVEFSGGTILLLALFYPIPGIRADGTELTYPSILGNLPGSLVETALVVAESIYFSTVTFTTLGYGDVEPVGWAKALATVESFSGALLMALLVYVLGRRTTR